MKKTGFLGSGKSSAVRANCSEVWGADPVPVRMRRAFPDCPRLMASEASFNETSVGLWASLVETGGLVKPKNRNNLVGANKRSMVA